MKTPYEDVISYKWDDNTYTGYLLHYDTERAHQGVTPCFHVEAWENRTIIDDWWCSSIQEALRVLAQFFELDAQREEAQLVPLLQGNRAVHAA